MLLEFAAFIRLRIKKPDLHRPYKVPLQTFGATMLCLPPALLLVLVMCLASLRTYFVSGAVIILGFLLYPALVHTRDRKWINFYTNEEPKSFDNDDLEDQSVAAGEEVTDEASLSLLPEMPYSKVQESHQISSEGVSSSRNY